MRIWPNETPDRDGNYRNEYTWIALARNTYVQLLGAVGFAGLICGGYWAHVGTSLSAPFSSLSEFHAFVFGVATVYAIAGPVLFGFLMQELQGCRQEQSDVYWKFNEAVSELRGCVAGMAENGHIHYRISDRLLKIEGIRLDKIDGLHQLHSVFGDINRIAEWVAKRKGGPRWSEREAKLLCLLCRVEERLSMLGVNFVRRICVAAIQDSVMKCLWCVGGLIAVSVLALGFYAPQTQGIFFLGATALASFGIFITLELATLAAQQVREVMPPTAIEDATTDFDDDEEDEDEDARLAS